MPRLKTKRILVAIAGILIIVAGWAAIDLWKPVSSSLRQFDPEEVARLETDMWRAYYAKQSVPLFNQLAELLRLQYRLPFLRSYLVAYRGAKAAFVFKDGKNRADYERALPDLLKYYEAIRKVSDTPFDVNRVSQLELEWWIIHRERATHALDDLARALAELQAEIYRVPVERLMEHGRLRAEAMTIRDSKAEAGPLTEADWAKIEELLRASWRSLAVAVKS